jgi:hypothetical protein
LESFGRDFEARTSSTSLSTLSSSPGRTGSGQRNSSKPAPTMPPGAVDLTHGEVLEVVLAHVGDLLGGLLGG